MNRLENFVSHPFITIGHIARWLCDGVFEMTFGLTTLQLYSRFLYFPGVAWNTVSWRWRKYQWYNRIDNTIVLGALPFRSQAEEVRKYNIGLPLIIHAIIPVIHDCAQSHRKLRLFNKPLESELYTQLLVNNPISLACHKSFISLT